MNPVSEVLRPYAEGFKAIESRHAGKAKWLNELRRDAFAQFTARGFPGERDEDWKYSSTRSLEKRSFVTALSATSDIHKAALDPILLHELPAHTLIFINGQYAPSLGDAVDGIPGLHISALRKSLQQDAKELQAWLAPESIWNADAFTALNTAFLQDGVLIETDDDTQLQQPLQLVVVSTEQAQPSACHPRILMKLGKRSQAALVETYYGLEGSANFTNSFTQILLGDGAQLQHLRIQRESPADFHVSRVAISQQHASSYTSHNFNLGGLWVRTDLETRLEASQAHAVFNGLYSISGRQHVDNHTRIDHLAPDTHSDELYHGIISGHARAVFNGKVIVAKHAVKTDAAQSNNNLLLSRGAEIDTKPELEIYADDVQCSHGATIGQLDEQALFYLRSRGIDEQSARGMLVEAFAYRLIERIAAPELRAYAIRQINSVLPGLTAVMAQS
ncbi:MAG TPA: Fe-S cluster assembly protein SufD [Gammaproteobacteria bacterium]|nr:Fe-S cluster assembly protein SufD [Gammaproteobacteria bacterium]